MKTRYSFQLGLVAALLSVSAEGQHVYVTPKYITRQRMIHARTIHRADQNAHQKPPVIPNFPDSNTETAKPVNNPNPNNFNYSYFPPPTFANNGFGAAAVGTNVVTRSSSAKTNVIETARSEGPKAMPIHEATGPAYNDSDPLIGYQREQAEKGNPESQYAMGLRYLNGVGVEQSDVLAREWLEKSSAGGNLNARAKLRELNAPLDLTDRSLSK